MDVERAADDRFAGLPDYPFAPNWLELDGCVRMHYVDEGAGKPVLFLHGEPTWSFLWRHCIPRVVSAGRRAVAPDMIGFGRSDKPEDQGWYTYDRHVALVTEFVRELDLRDIALVVHDWGGLIGLRFAVENADRVERLVILDTGVWSGKAPSETWLRFREAIRSVGGEIDIARLVESGTQRGLSDEVRAAYNAPFPTPESKAGALAFPELVPVEPNHPTAAALEPVREGLARWDKPAHIIWGAEDGVLPTAIAEQFIALIPGASGPEVVAGAGHFLQEDAPTEVATAIVREFS
ncbi:MAG TPA: haloalkane dehalogenase [Gaiellaceae bacterium]